MSDTYGALSDYGEQWTLYVTLLMAQNVTRTSYLALYSTNPTDTDIGVEISGNGYSRVQLPLFTRDGDFFENTEAITFPAATGPWGTVKYMGIRSAPTGGKLLFRAWLTEDREDPVIGIDDVFEIGTGNLRINMLGSVSDYTEDGLLNFFLNQGTYSFPTPNSYIGFLTEEGEIRGKNYARINIGKQWFDAHVDHGSDYYSTHNKYVLSTNRANEDWGTVTKVGIYDAAEGGNCIYLHNLTESEYVYEGDGLRFLIEALTVKIS